MTTVIHGSDRIRYSPHSGSSEYTSDFTLCRPGGAEHRESGAIRFQVTERASMVTCRRCLRILSR